MRVAASAKVRRVLTTSLLPAVTRIPTGRAGALLRPMRHGRGTPRRAPAGNRRPAGRKAAGTRYQGPAGRRRSASTLRRSGMGNGAGGPPRRACAAPARSGQKVMCNMTCGEPRTPPPPPPPPPPLPLPAQRLPPRSAAPPSSGPPSRRPPTAFCCSVPPPATSRRPPPVHACSSKSRRRSGRSTEAWKGPARAGPFQGPSLAPIVPPNPVGPCARFNLVFLLRQKKLIMHRKNSNNESQPCTI